MKFLLMLLLATPLQVQAQWRDIKITSSTDTQAIQENFRRASLWSNRKFDKFSNDTIYGIPTFHKGITFADGTTQTTAVSPYPIGPTYYVIKTIAQDASFLLQVDNDGALLMSTTTITTLNPWLFMTGNGKTWRISAASDNVVQTDLLGFILSGGKIPLISANGTLYLVGVEQDNALSTIYMGAL